MADPIHLPDQFELIRPLGTGGMSDVYLVRDRTSGDLRALKRLRVRGPEAEELIRNEFGRLARIEHDNIVRVFDYGVLPDGDPYFTMEFLEGESLNEAVRPGDVTGALRAMRGVLAGLEALHAAGLVHCDVHGSNVRLVPGPDGGMRVKLLDLGLAGRLSDEASERVRGRPGYVAPEVLGGATYTRESDYFSLGAMLYRVLTGRMAFPGRDPAEILAAQRRGAPPVLPLRTSQVPAKLETVVLQLLSGNPEHRVIAARELSESAARRSATTGAEAPKFDVLRGFGPLIGRAELLDDLRRELLQNQRAAAAVLYGPNGSGRTRLAREVAVEADLAGWTVHWYDGVHLPRRVSIAPPSTRTLVVADDVDTWSEPALERLRHILSGVTCSLLFVQARPPSPGDSSLRLIVVLRDPQSPRSLSVGPLEPNAVAQFAAQRLGGSISEATLRLVTGGVGTMPGAILTALDQWIARDWLVREGDHWRATEEAPSATLTGEAIHGEGDALLARLHPLLRLAAFVVACWPPADPLERLARASGLSTSNLLNSLEDLEWSGALQSDGNLRRILPASLAQALRRDRTHANLERLRPMLRSALQERIGESTPSPSRDQALARAWCLIALASHEFAMGDPDQARAHALESLETAISLDATLADEASQLLLQTCVSGDVRHASQIVRMAQLWARDGAAAPAAESWAIARNLLPASESTLKAEWAVQHAQVLSNMYQYSLALPILDTILEEHSAEGLDAELVGRARGLRGWCRASLGDHERGVEDLRAAAGALTRDDDPDRAIALMRLGITLALGGDPKNGDRLLGEALRLAQTQGAPEIEARIRSNLALRYRIAGDLLRADNEAQAGLALLGEEGEARLRSFLILRILGTAYDRCDWAMCAEAQRALEVSGRRSGNLVTLSESMTSRATVGLLRGSVSDVVSALRRARTWIRRSENTEAQHWWQAQSGLALGWIGEELESQRRLKRCFSRASALKLSMPRALAARGLAQLSLVQQKLKPARRWYRLAMEDRGSELSTAIPASLGLARIAAQERNRPGIDEARGHLERHPGSNVAPEVAPALAEMDALALVLEGRLEEAESRLAEAVAILRTLDLAPSEIMAEWQFSRAVLVENQALAREHLVRAHALAQRSGIGGWSRRIAEELSVTQPQIVLSAAHGATRHDFLPRAIELLNSLQEYPILLQRSLELAAETVGADRGFILLKDETAGGLKTMAAFGTVDDETRENARQVSRTIVRRVTRTGESFLTEEVDEDPRLGSTQSLLDMAVRSLLCVALPIRDRIIGTIYLESRTHAAQFSEDDRDLLESFAHLVAVAIENGRLQDELRRSRDRVIGENLSLRRDATRAFARPNIIAQSDQMERILDEVERVAMSKMSVLITGETGTGKELISKSIHYASPRADQPFIAVNCAAINADLMESELFGIVSGAASNVTEHRGYFERAHGGTLFLDEIGDMPLQLQTKVLRVLEEHEFTPVRGTRLIRADFRLVSATNKDLRELVRQKAFREDLYFRVLGHEIHLPPLRERKVDIPLLAEHFLRRFCDENAIPLPRISPEFVAVVMGHSWEGNIRDLRNYVERCTVLSRGAILRPVFLPTEVGFEDEPGLPSKRGSNRTATDRQGPARELKTELRDHESSMIIRALEQTGWNQRQAADLLKLSEATLRNRMARLQITSPTGFRPKRGRPSSRKS